MVITTSGSIASFKTPAKQPLKSLKVYFSPIQNGSGDPSPSNVRPITGRTGLEVTRCGKNLFHYDESKVVTMKNPSGSDRKTFPLPFLFNQKSVVFSAEAIDENDWADANVNIFEYNNNNNSNHIWSFFGPDSGPAYREKIIDLTNSYGSLMNTSNSVSTLTLKINKYNIQIELGSKGTTYEPYSGTTIPVDWSSEAGTVYKGYVDVVSGNLVVTHKMITLTGSEPNAIYNWDGYCFAISDGASDNSNVHVAACSHTNHLTSGGAYFESRPNGSYPQNEYNSVLCALTQGPNIRFRKRDTGFASLEDYQTYLQAQYNAGTPVQIVYELATPLTYSITPNTVQALIGRNNIFSDADTVEAVYDHADTMDMVRLRQKVLKGCQVYKTVLPPGYQRVSYIRSDGPYQYFEPGVDCSDTTLEFEVEMAMSRGNYSIPLSNYSSDKLVYCIAQFEYPNGSDRGLYLTGGRSRGYRNGVNIVPNGESYVDKLIKYHFSYGVVTTECNGYVVTKVDTIEDYPISTAPLRIGQGAIVKKIWAAKFWSHGFLIRNYIPVVRKIDNIAGFYDLVNHTFNPSIGSTNFVAVND